MAQILPGTNTLICIDPGEWAGYSLWSGLRLIRCGKMPDGARWGGTGVADTCICELPRIYPMGKSASRPNDIIKLAITAGRITAPWDNVIWVPPHEWKGQVPDDILEKRILGKLTSEELACFTALDLPKSRKHNVTDAIGIGLHHLKRMGTGGT